MIDLMALFHVLQKYVRMPAMRFRKVKAILLLMPLASNEIKLFVMSSLNFRSFDLSDLLPKVFKFAHPAAPLVTKQY